MEEVFPEEGKKFTPISDCSRQTFGEPNNEFIKEEITDGRSISRGRKEIHAYQWLFQTDHQGTRQNITTKTWYLVTSSAIMDVHVSLSIRFPLLKSRSTQLWSRSSNAHDTCLLVDKRTNSRKEVGYLDEQQERDKAKDALRNCTRHGFDSIPDRCIEDDRYTESQLSIGWSEEEAKASDVLGSNDDTYQASKEERDLNSEQRSKKDRGLLPLIP